MVFFINNLSYRRSESIGVFQERKGISSGSVIRCLTLGHLREQVANVQAESKHVLKITILDTRT